MNLHSGYRIFWIIWMGIEIGALMMGWYGIMVARAGWIYFGIIEGLAVSGGKPGRTLSDFMQSIATMGPESKWWQGWPALVTMLTALASMQAGWTAAYGIESLFWQIAVGGVVGIGVFFWLIFHWLNTEKHG